MFVHIARIQMKIVIYTHMILNIFLLLIYNIYNTQWVSTQVLATYPIVNIQKYIHMVLVL